MELVRMSRLPWLFGTPILVRVSGKTVTSRVF